MQEFIELTNKSEEETRLTRDHYAVHASIPPITPPNFAMSSIKKTAHHGQCNYIGRESARLVIKVEDGGAALTQLPIEGGSTSPATQVLQKLQHCETGR